MPHRPHVDPETCEGNRAHLLLDFRQKQRSLDALPGQDGQRGPDGPFSKPEMDHFGPGCNLYEIKNVANHENLALLNDDEIQTVPSEGSKDAKKITFVIGSVPSQH